MVRYFLGFRSLSNLIILFSSLCTEMAFEDRKGKAREEKTMSYLKSSSSEFPSVVQAVLRELLSFNLGEKISRQDITGQAQ